MTEHKPDNDDVQTVPNTSAAPPQPEPTQPSQPYTAPIQPVAATAAPAPKSGRGLAGFALLIALGAAGGSGYLWYLWQQEQATQTTRLEQAIKQAIAQRDPEFQALKAQVQELQALKTALGQLRSETQDVKSQTLGLTGDLQPLKNAMELQKGENTVIKSEMKLLRESHDAHKAAVQQQQEELSKHLQEQQNRLAQANEHIQNLKLSYNGLAENLEVVKTVAAQGGDVNAFPLAEVDYLLRLADTKLKLERNVAAASLALDTAQQRLRTVNESGLAPVQTMIAEAIASLRGVRLPDLNALAHKVAEMGQTVDGLPLKLTSAVPDIKNRVKPSTSVTVDTDVNRSWWERSTEAVWGQFKDIVVVRRERSNAPPLIAMENEFFLRQNLRLELESMRTALLRGDAEIYQDSYNLVRDWTETYFDVQDARVATFLKELQALQTIQFNPYIPDLAGVNQTFREMMSRRQPVRAVRKATAAPAEQPATTEEAKP